MNLDRNSNMAVLFVDLSNDTEIDEIRDMVSYFTSKKGQKYRPSKIHVVFIGFSAIASRRVSEFEICIKATCILSELYHLERDADIMVIVHSRNWIPRAIFHLLNFKKSKFIPDDKFIIKNKIYYNKKDHITVDLVNKN